MALDVFGLDGRTAVVTGGNQGLGKAFALALARSGARVAVAARNGDRTQEVVDEAAEQGLELVRIDADLTADADSASATLTAAAAGFGDRRQRPGRADVSGRAGRQPVSASARIDRRGRE